MILSVLGKAVVVGMRGVNSHHDEAELVVCVVLPRDVTWAVGFWRRKKEVGAKWEVTVGWLEVVASDLFDRFNNMSQGVVGDNWSSADSTQSEVGDDGGEGVNVGVRGECLAAVVGVADLYRNTSRQPAPQPVTPSLGGGGALLRHYSGARLTRYQWWTADRFLRSSGRQRLSAHTGAIRCGELYLCADP